MKRKPATRKQAKRAKPSPRRKSAVQDSDINKHPEFAIRVERALLRAGEKARRPLVCTAHLSTCWKMVASLPSVRERDARRTS